MTFTRRFLAALMALCIAIGCTSALADTTAPTVPTVGGLFRQAGYASEGSDTVYFIIVGSTGSTNLYSAPVAGGDITLVETADGITSVVASGANAYYVRLVNGSWQLVRRSGANVTVLQVFAAGATVSGLGYYDGVLYIIVDHRLFSFDATTGEEKLVSDQLMSEYFIIGGRVYFISTEDQRTYSRTHTVTGTVYQATQGCLYSMALDGSDVQTALEVGISDLSGYGEYLYYHDMSDSYLVSTASGDDMWLEGHVHRFNHISKLPEKVLADYDWGFFPSSKGLVVYTMNSIDLVDLSVRDNATNSYKTSTNLMKPEYYTSVKVEGDEVLVYEINAQKLTRIPLGGAATLLATGLPTGAALTTVETTGQYVEGADLTPAVTTTKAPTTTTTTTTGGGTKKTTGGGSYIFPESASRKLTTADLKKVSPTLWAYGRNEIMARHGREFVKTQYANYFAKQGWYKPGNYSTKSLSSIEWYNMEFILKYEKLYAKEIATLNAGGTLAPKATSGATSAPSPTTAPSDSSYIIADSNTRLLTEAEILALDRSLWAYARNEILARHGYEFQKAQYAKYFGNKTWYKPGFSSKDMTNIEWANIELIKKLEASH